MAPPAPCGPVAPVAPTAPVAPVDPVAPVAPFIPAGPVAPVAPAGPAGPAAPAADNNVQLPGSNVGSKIDGPTVGAVQKYVAPPNETTSFKKYCVPELQEPWKTNPAGPGTP